MIKHKLILIAALLAGCAGTVEAPKDAGAAKVVTHKVISQSVKAPRPDNFDKAGHAAAVSGRWVYDESKKMWAWVTSEQTKKSANNAYHTAVDMAGSAIDAAKKAYREHYPESGEESK